MLLVYDMLSADIMLLSDNMLSIDSMFQQIACYHMKTGWLSDNMFQI
jgi:hypothetical protein